MTFRKTRLAEKIAIDIFLPASFHKTIPHRKFAEKKKFRIEKKIVSNISRPLTFARKLYGGNLWRKKIPR